MHRISHPTVRDFRACREVSLPLVGDTPLVGQNNAGKLTILQAIAWALTPTALLSADFFDPQAPVEVAVCSEGKKQEQK